MPKRSKLSSHTAEERKEASALLCYAVRAGKVVKPDACQLCKRSDVTLEGHHIDYDDPYDVRWFCRQCHRDVHTWLREQNELDKIAGLA